LSGLSGCRSLVVLEVVAGVPRHLVAGSTRFDQLPARKLIPSRIAMVASAMTPPSAPGAKPVPRACARVLGEAEKAVEDSYRVGEARGDVGTLAVRAAGDTERVLQCLPVLAESA
jgi:hypothetical protein